MSEDKHDAATQQHKFIETARSLGSDEDEAAFKAKLAVIARQKPQPEEGAMVSEADDLAWLVKALADIEAGRRKKKLINDNPYVLHLLQVLVPKGLRGMRRQDVIDAVMERRRGAGLPIPKKPVETIQSALQQHCIHSKVFVNSGASPSQGLFLWPRGPGAGLWAADRTVAMAWAREREREI